MKYLLALPLTLLLLNTAYAITPQPDSYDTNPHPQIAAEERIPAKSIQLPADKIFEITVGSQTRLYNLHIKYNMLADPRHPKIIICRISNKNKSNTSSTYLGRTYQNSPEVEDEINAPYEWAFTAQDPYEKSNDPSENGKKRVPQVADSKGEIIIHVINRYVEGWEFWPTTVKCRYVGPN